MGHDSNAPPTLSEIASYKSWGLLVNSIAYLSNQHLKEIYGGIILSLPIGKLIREMYISSCSYEILTRPNIKLFPSHGSTCSYEILTNSKLFHVIWLYVLA